MEEMPGIPSDTNLAAKAEYYRMVRSLSPAEKLRRTLDFFQMSREMIASNIRRRFPEIDDREFRYRFAKETLNNLRARKCD